MEEITVKKSRLIEIITKNRTEHRAIFDEACVGYAKMMEQELETRLKEIRSGKKIVRITAMAVPEDHTGDYDRVLKMLDLAEETEIVLQERDVAMYIMDDWQWKQNFLISNSHYSVAAMRALSTSRDV